ncbi:rhamnolipids biosynthesis 3-oxoacyl-reductase [Lentinula raphanica]|uniref:Rhamnolipids biosynthesis 3-oxoacyl-reductase n=1 Tax=Lentinula raphanica TaxID=153919 RepID=A0AA38P7T4_9AGAR|nr:rhamnolipids biosynthesis 3-oxoacyl-reductase [Lentinula raphanica]KAJ3837673.1 rhamnolipids biosynthesis 3-oxoacyl-reductase [Lentinula raphanica]
MFTLTPDLKITSLFNVKDKIVLVTGGSAGIGKMIASGFAHNGAKVYIASRKESQLQEAVAEINADLKKAGTSGYVSYIVANVGSKAGCNSLIDEFKKRESKLHVLVNNSGITWGGPYEDFPEDKGWDNVFNVNVKSIFYMTAGLTELLSKDSNNRDPGRVINISSTASIDPRSEGALSRPGNGTWSYQPSKAAVNHLTSQLALKLAPRHVTVNAILPGVFPSKMTAFGLQTAGDATFVANQPTGRYGSIEDMAGMSLFLASPASSHVTGAHIMLDGGARYNVRPEQVTKL